MSTEYTSTRDINSVELEQKKAHTKNNMWFNAISIPSVVTVVVTIGLLMTSPKYEATALISFDPIQIEDHWDLMRDDTRVVDFEGQIRSRAVLAPALEEVQFKQRSSGFLKKMNWGFAQPVAGLKSTEKMARTIKKFQPYLTVERIRQSSLLRIDVRLTSPEMAANSANAIARSFLNLKRSQFLEKTQERLDAIEREMERVRQELTSTMNQRNKFLKENGWNDYDLEVTTVTNRVSLLKQNLIKYEFGNDISTIKELIQNSPITISGNSSLFGQQQDASLVQLVQKLNELEIRDLRIKSRFKEDSPPVLDIAREKKDLEKIIADYTSQRTKSLTTQLASAQKEWRRLLDAGSKIQVFQVAIDQSEKGYQKLMDQRSAIRLQINSVDMDSQNFGPLRLLETALVPGTVSVAEKGLKVGATAFASFIISFSLLIIISTMWQQASGHLNKQHNAPVDPATDFNKLI